LDKNSIRYLNCPETFRRKSGSGSTGLTPITISVHDRASAKAARVPNGHGTGLINRATLPFGDIATRPRQFASFPNSDRITDIAEEQANGQKNDRAFAGSSFGDNYRLRVLCFSVYTELLAL
jgi:hypothetical protein